MSPQTVLTALLSPVVTVDFRLIVVPCMLVPCRCTIHQQQQRRAELGGFLSRPPTQRSGATILYALPRCYLPSTQSYPVHVGACMAAAMRPARMQGSCQLRMLKGCYKPVC
jgi:hypothetical protein